VRERGTEGRKEEGEGRRRQAEGRMEKEAGRYPSTYCPVFRVPTRRTNPAFTSGRIRSVRQVSVKYRSSCRKRRREEGEGRKGDGEGRRREEGEVFRRRRKTYRSNFTCRM
jgi:hypothetical protein